MTFRVLPESGGPMRLVAGDRSNPVEFDELATGDPGHMFLRIAKLNQEDCSLPGGPSPTILLSKDSGEQIEVTEDPNLVTIRNRDGVAVAKAAYTVELLDVYRVVVLMLLHRPGKWRLVIGNNDPFERRFTWVVADNDTDSKQPWINLPATAEFESGPVVRPTARINVANYGTGQLSISRGGLSPDTFQLLELPSRPIRPNTCDKLVIQFNSTQESADGQYQAQSDDPGPTHSAGHNHQIELLVRPKPQPDGPDPVTTGPRIGLRPCRQSPDGHCADYLPAPHTGGGATDPSRRCQRLECGHFDFEHEELQ
jgi:hypothetical protein